MEKDIPDSSLKIARISISDDAKDNLVYLNQAYNLKSNNFEIAPLDKNKITISGIMKQLSPFFAKRFNQWKNKSKIMNTVDIYDSISYLEAQVDALTKLVLKLTTDDSEEKKILTAADSSSVLNIKSEDSILKEFQNKKLVRDLQKGYYAET